MGQEWCVWEKEVIAFKFCIDICQNNLLCIYTTFNCTRTQTMTATMGKCVLQYRREFTFYMNGYGLLLNIFMLVSDFCVFLMFSLFFFPTLKGKGTYRRPLIESTSIWSSSWSWKIKEHLNFNSVSLLLRPTIFITLSYFFLYLLLFIEF